MILEGLLDLIYWYMDFTMVFEIPKLPNEVYGYAETAFEYIASGGGILANYTHLPYLMSLFTLLLAVDFGIALFHFVMWIIRKIPFTGIT